MVKVTLAAIPNYFLSLFTIPVSVANKIESMFKWFIWDDDPKHHRYHLIDWNTCCQSFENGGLGIRRIKLHNKALLSKWLWRFGMERDSLWRKVVVARFGEESNWESRKVRGRHGCGI